MKFHRFRYVSVFTLVCLLTTVAQGQTTIYVGDDVHNDPGPGDPMVSDDLADGTYAIMGRMLRYGWGTHLCILDAGRR